MKMCVLVKTGDECPGGTTAFHFTFFVGPNSTGTLVAPETPVPFGPRKRDQFSASAKASADKSAAARLAPTIITSAAVNASRLLSMRPILAKNPSPRLSSAEAMAAAVTSWLALSALAAYALDTLGLGVQPPTPSWGAMIADGRDLSQLRSSPWTSLFPGLAIGVTVLGFNLLGDALRDALDPRTA